MSYSYAVLLDRVKRQHPDMPYKDKQKLASALYQGEVCDSIQDSKYYKGIIKGKIYKKYHDSRKVRVDKRSKELRARLALRHR